MNLVPPTIKSKINTVNKVLANYKINNGYFSKKKRKNERSKTGGTCIKQAPSHS
jgi:iron uptake system EfeUOB component EfeO/EfeM